MGGLLDNPNQQVVRPDGSGPGIGHEGVEQPRAAVGETSPPPLDQMTKAELLEYAKQLGVSPANNDMTKDELRAAVDAKLTEA